MLPIYNWSQNASEPERDIGVLHTYDISTYHMQEVIILNNSEQTNVWIEYKTYIHIMITFPPGLSITFTCHSYCICHFNFTSVNSVSDLCALMKSDKHATWWGFLGLIPLTPKRTCYSVPADYFTIWLGVCHRGEGITRLMLKMNLL